MTLRRRLVWQLAMLLACLGVTAGVGLFQVAGAGQDFSLALDRYEKLRELYQVGFHLQAARLALSLDFPDAARARLEVRRAVQAFARQAAAIGDRAKVSAVGRALAQTAAAMDAPRPSAGAIDAAYGALQQLVEQFRSDITAAQRASDDRKRSTIVWLTVVAAAAIAVSVLTAVRQYRAVMRPLRDVSAGARRLAAGTFRPALRTACVDAEFAALAADFNVMAARLESTLADMQQRVESATRTLVQSERLAGVGLLAAGVAHEVNNPLSIISGRLELLLLQTTDDVARKQIGELIEEAFRCKAIIERLLQLSRGPSGRRTRVRLDELVSSAVEAVRQLPTANDRAIGFKGVATNVLADAGELRQVVVNLLINAVNFTQPGRTIEVAVGPGTTGAAGQAEIEVWDDGMGMTADEMRQIFEPFFSTRRDRPGDAPRGSGLGLAISRAIVESHGGRIDAFSDGPGRGSRFVVGLPVADDGGR